MVVEAIINMLHISYLKYEGAHNRGTNEGNVYVYLGTQILVYEEFGFKDK